MSGPFISALINKIGFRPTGFIGAAFTCIGLLLSAYMETIPLLILTFSFISTESFLFNTTYLCLNYFSWYWVWYH